MLMAALAVPLGWSAWAALRGAFDLAAWQGVWADTQTWRAVRLTLFTGVLASGLAMALAAWLLSHHFPDADGPPWCGHWGLFLPFRMPLLPLAWLF